MLTVADRHPIHVRIQSRKAAALTADDLVAESAEGAVFMGFDVTELRGKIQDALLGYLAMDLIDPPEGACWGQFNDRPIELKWIKDLTRSFQEDGVDNCIDKTAIEVAVRPDAWLKNRRVGGTEAKEAGEHMVVGDGADADADAEKLDGQDILPSVEGKKIHKVPLMQFTSRGKEEVKKDQLWILGGHHRREALKDRREKKALELEACRKSLESLGDGAGTQSEARSALAQKIKELEKLLAEEKLWVVKLYDRGK